MFDSDSTLCVRAAFYEIATSGRKKNPRTRTLLYLARRFLLCSCFFSRSTLSFSFARCACYRSNATFGTGVRETLDREMFIVQKFRSREMFDVKYFGGEQTSSLDDTFLFLATSFCL